VGPGRMPLDTVALTTEILKKPVNFLVMPTGKTVTSQTKRAAPANNKGNTPTFIVLPAPTVIRNEACCACK